MSIYNRPMVYSYSSEYEIRHHLVYLLELLIRLDYNGAVNNIKEFRTAFFKGPPNQHFLDVTSWLCLELAKQFEAHNRFTVDSKGTLKSEIREDSHPFKAPLLSSHPFYKPLAKPLAFFVELSSLLEVLACPIKEIVSGNISQKLLFFENKICTVEYLIQELRAAKIVATFGDKVDKPFEILLEESKTAKELKQMLIALNFSRPPHDIESSALFNQVGKRSSKTITSIFDTFREKISTNPAVEMSDVIAATADMAIGDRVSSGAVCRNTHSSIYQFKIGDVPDRGGRPNEQAPPPPEVPSWQPRCDSRGRGRPPFSASRGRLVTPDRGTYIQAEANPRNNFPRPMEMVAPVAGDNFAQFGHVVMEQHVLHNTPFLINTGMQVASPNIPNPGYGVPLGHAQFGWQEAQGLPLAFSGQGAQGVPLAFSGQGAQGVPLAFSGQGAHGGPNDFSGVRAQFASDQFRIQGARFQRGHGGRGGRGRGNLGGFGGFGHQGY